MPILTSRFSSKLRRNTPSYNERLHCASRSGRGLIVANAASENCWPAVPDFSWKSRASVADSNRVMSTKTLIENACCLDCGRSTIRKLSTGARSRQVGQVAGEPCATIPAHTPDPSPCTDRRARS
jgi:hypothetical protein